VSDASVHSISIFGIARPECRLFVSAIFAF